MHSPRILSFFATVCLLALISAPTVFAGAQEDLDKVMKRIKAKVEMGKTTEVDLGAELVQLSDLQTKYKSQKADAAMFLFARATVYGEVINDREMALMLYDEVRHSFPNTMAAIEADQKMQAMLRPAPQRQTPRNSGGSRNNSSSSGGGNSGR